MWQKNWKSDTRNVDLEKVGQILTILKLKDGCTNFTGI